MEILVQHFDEIVYGLQVAQIIVVHVHADAEIQTRIAAIHNFEVAKLFAEKTEYESLLISYPISKNTLSLSLTSPYLNEVCMLGIAYGHNSMHLLDQLLLLVIVEIHVPFGQARLTRSVLDQNKSNLPESGFNEWGCS